MKNIFRYLFIIFCLFTSTNPLHAQWRETYANESAAFFRDIAVTGTNVFVGMSNSGIGVVRSTNNGATWQEANTGLTSTFISALVVSDTNLFAGTTAGLVFRSTNNGISWSKTSADLIRWVADLAVSGTNLFAGTSGNGVFRSTDNGTSWTAVNTDLTNTSVSALAVSGTNLFAGTRGGVFRSTNNGTNWTPASSGLPTNTSVPALAVSGTNLFAGVSNFPTSGGVFLSTNNGTSWNSVSTGLPTDARVEALAATSTYLIAGNSNFLAGVWRRPLSEMTSVERLSTDLPTHFSLDQNYPNPFNPATTISFGVPSKSFVSLKVFDALGREVSSLVEEELTAGTYSQKWNAEGVASGVYFYRLQAGSFVETKKLLLLR